MTIIVQGVEVTSRADCPYRITSPEGIQWCREFTEAQAVDPASIDTGRAEAHARIEAAFGTAEHVQAYDEAVAQARVDRDTLGAYIEKEFAKAIARMLFGTDEPPASSNGPYTHTISRSASGPAFRVDPWDINGHSPDLIIVDEVDWTSAVRDVTFPPVQAYTSDDIRRLFGLAAKLTGPIDPHDYIMNASRP